MVGTTIVFFRNPNADIPCRCLSGPTILIVPMKYVRDSDQPEYPECKDLMGHEELPGRGYHPQEYLAVN